jgi:hypothetical protein
LTIVGTWWPGGATSASVVGATVAVTRGFARVLVEGDPQVDLDLPASDAHVVDDEAQELLALLEAELVDANRGRAGEIADSLLQFGKASEHGYLTYGRHRAVAFRGRSNNSCAAFRPKIVDVATNDSGEVDTCRGQNR